MGASAAGHFMTIGMENSFRDMVSEEVCMRTNRAGKQVRCLRLQTTLYEVIQMLQEEITADDDHLVVAVVAQWFDEGRIKTTAATRWRGSPWYDRRESQRVSIGRAS